MQQSAKKIGSANFTPEFIPRVTKEASMTSNATECEKER